MTYIITYKGKNLNAIYFNGNGTVSDMIKFSNKSYIIFEDEGGAWDYLNTMHDKIIERKDDLVKGLFAKLDKIINNCEIKDVTPYQPVFEKEQLL
jgi:hypothetical protein